MEKLFTNKKTFITICLLTVALLIASAVSVILLMMSEQANWVEIALYFIIVVFIAVANVLTHKKLWNLSIGVYIPPLCFIILYHVYTISKVIEEAKQASGLGIMNIFNIICSVLSAIGILIYLVHHILINYYDVKHKVTLFRINKYLIFIVCGLLLAGTVFSLIAHGTSIHPLRIVTWFSADLAYSLFLVIVYSDQLFLNKDATLVE